MLFGRATLPLYATALNYLSGVIRRRANGLPRTMNSAALGLPCSGLTALQALSLFPSPQSYAVRGARR